MITLTIPPQALRNALRVEHTIDVREFAQPGIGMEVFWLLVPVYSVAKSDTTKQVANGEETRIEFSSTDIS